MSLSTIMNRETNTREKLSVEKRKKYVLIPVLVTPEKTQHWPYLTGFPPVLWYCLRISTLPFHNVGDVPFA